jgi:hypothetical protein
MPLEYFPSRVNSESTRPKYIWLTEIGKKLGICPLHTRMDLVCDNKKTR